MKDKGTIITGGPGTGKTAAILQLVENSSFGSRKENYGREFDHLAKSVVGYHFCQVEDSITCSLANMIHSIAAQLVQVPSLHAYEHLLSTDEELRSKLSLSRCLEDPDAALVEAILLPLSKLNIEGKINEDDRIILIDALCASQVHQTDYGDTLISFLAKHLLHFPSFIKLVLTIRTEKIHLTESLPFMSIR